MTGHGGTADVRGELAHPPRDHLGLGLGPQVQVVRRRRAPGRRSLGRVTGSPASCAAARLRNPKFANASANLCTDGSGAITSTRSPCSSAVFAVAGPMHAITVTLCGLPAMPTRFRTVDDEVKRTASKPPP